MKLNQKGVVYIVLLGVFLVICSAGLIFYFTQKKDQPAVNTVIAISGTIDLNGVVPNGATIAIGKKGFNEAGFQIIVENLPATDRVKWVWNQAKAGEQYQVQAYLRQDNKDIVSSEIKTIAAPATDETLSLNLPAPKVVGQNTSSTISGTFDINGYLPTGSTISIAVRILNSSANFRTIVSNLPVVDKSSWSWVQAETGQNYEVKAIVLNNNKVIAESLPRAIAAPASDEVLRVVSQAAPVVSSTALISGNINFNGIAPNGSSIVIVARSSGTTPFKVVADSIPAQDGASWSWNSASVGTMYDLQAVLKNNNNDLAISRTLTVAAPASNEVLTLNSNFQQPQPSQAPSFSCANQSGGLWSINITWNYVTISNQQAAQYWIRLGDPNSDNRFMDTRVSAQNQSGQTQQSITSPNSLGSGGTYYIKYAYSLSSNASDLSNFSAWSNVSTVICPSPTPVPTSIPTPAPTPVPTSTPTPAPTAIPTDS